MSPPMSDRDERLAELRQQGIASEAALRRASEFRLPLLVRASEF